MFEAFKKAKKGLLLCTDVMARGKFNLFTISTLILTLRRLKSRVLLLLVVFSRYSFKYLHFVLLSANFLRMILFLSENFGTSIDVKKCQDSSVFLQTSEQSGQKANYDGDI